MMQVFSQPFYLSRRKSPSPAASRTVSVSFGVRQAERPGVYDIDLPGMPSRQAFEAALKHARSGNYLLDRYKQMAEEHHRSILKGIGEAFRCIPEDLNNPTIAFSEMLPNFARKLRKAVTSPELAYWRSRDQKVLNLLPRGDHPCHMNGDIAHAYRDFRKALELEPLNAIVYDWLGFFTLNVLREIRHGELSKRPMVAKAYQEAGLPYDKIAKEAFERAILLYDLPKSQLLPIDDLSVFPAREYRQAHLGLGRYYEEVAVDPAKALPLLVTYALTSPRGEEIIPRVVNLYRSQGLHKEAEDFLARMRERGKVLDTHHI